MLIRRIVPFLPLAVLPCGAGVRAQAASTAGGGGFPFGLLLVIGIAVFVVIAWRGARKRAEEQQRAAYASRQEPFGRFPETGQPPYANSSYDAPQPGYPPPQQPSMGGAIARGLGAGLAMGAGAAVASEIGHRMFDHQRGTDPHPAAGHHDAGANADSPLARDAGLGALTGRPDVPPDFGGNDFGVDPGGWDDAGGGGDWDT